MLDVESAKNPYTTLILLRAGNLSHFVTDYMWRGHEKSGRGADSERLSSHENVPPRLCRSLSSYSRRENFLNLFTDDVPRGP